MSPSKKKSPRRSKPTHVKRRHTEPVVPVVPAPVNTTAHDLDELLEIAKRVPADKIGRVIACARRIIDDESVMPPLDPIRPNFAYSIPLSVDGSAIGDLQVRPDADDALVRIAIDRIGSPGATTGATIARDPAERTWLDLGARLGELGPHRLTIAAHAAQAAATGGVSVSPEEEEQLCSWFSRIVEELIERGGTVEDGDEFSPGAEDGDEFSPIYPGAVAAWHLVCGDRVRSPRSPAGITRCPAQDQEGCAPGEKGFLAHIRKAAPSYMQTVIGGASEREIEELRSLVGASGAELESYRPWGRVFCPDESLAQQMIARAIRGLALRNPTPAEVCSAIEGWAHGFASVVASHQIPPVSRIGALCWLARVALRQAEHPMETTTGGAK